MKWTIQLWGYPHDYGFPRRMFCETRTWRRPTNQWIIDGHQEQPGPSCKLHCKVRNQITCFKRPIRDVKGCFLGLKFSHFMAKTWGTWVLSFHEIPICSFNGSIHYCCNRKPFCSPASTSISCTLFEAEQGGHHCRQRRKLKILETTHQFLLNLSVVTNPPCSDVLFLIWSWNIASACGHFRMCIGARVPQIPAASDAIGPIPSSCR